MIVTSTGIIDGIIDDKYGKRGTQFNENGIPSCSLPLKFEDAPEGTVCYALVVEDKDACPVTGGFSWIHWMAADITRNELLEDESGTAKDMVQGANSWMSVLGGEQSKELSSYYGGMTPPDAPHCYEIHVFALDATLNLPNGFFLNELYREMEGHVLDQFTLKGIYRN